MQKQLGQGRGNRPQAMPIKTEIRSMLKAAKPAAMAGELTAIGAVSTLMLAVEFKEATGGRMKRHYTCRIWLISDMRLTMPLSLGITYIQHSL